MAQLDTEQTYVSDYVLGAARTTGIFRRRKIHFSVIEIVITEIRHKREMWSHNRAIQGLIPFFLLLTKDSMRSEFLQMKIWDNYWFHRDCSDLR